MPSKENLQLEASLVRLPLRRKKGGERDGERDRMRNCAQSTRRHGSPCVVKNPGSITGSPGRFYLLMVGSPQIFSKPNANKV